MDFDYPDFLNEKPPISKHEHDRITNGVKLAADKTPPTRDRLHSSDTQPSVPFQSREFDKLLNSKLAFLDQQQDTVSPLRNSFMHSPRSRFSGFEPLFQDNYSHFNSPQFLFAEPSPLDSFHLPRELQGGIGHISSRRPSYAAESFTRSGPALLSAPMGNQPLTSVNKSSWSFAAANNYSKMFQNNAGYDQLVDSFGNFSLSGNSNFSDFQARRPSQVANFQPSTTQQHPHYGSKLPPHMAQHIPFTGPSTTVSSSALPSNFDTVLHLAHGPGSANYNQQVKLDNQLMLKNQHILSSAELKSLYASVSRYYQDPGISRGIVQKLKALSNNEGVMRLVAFIKNLNNLNIHHKMLCLVINKNGKLDLLSYPNNTSIFLQNGDMVIVDGDRGKDLVMVLEPLVHLDLAILFNFLKKIEHLRSLTITDSHGGSSTKNSYWSGTHSTSIDASTIVHNHLNDDNEFLLNLPTKQVLRFATPKDIQKLSGKFLEEKKAFVRCFNKIKELGLSNDLTLINVEYQFDFKKLIFYYFANFKRIDFRDLIKELFKIYKTRIWLCAVLPYDKPELYSRNKVGLSDASIASGRIPKEYDMATEQVLKFSGEDFPKIQAPSYFHLRNMANLVDNLEDDVQGHFYGFNSHYSEDTKPPRQLEGRRQSYSIQPSFNPFGETEEKI